MSYFISFSNQGVCQVESENTDAARKKVLKLGIHPECDDVMVWGVNEPYDLELDRLYSKQEMRDLGYFVFGD